MHMYLRGQQDNRWLHFSVHFPQQEVITGNPPSGREISPFVSPFSLPLTLLWLSPTLLYRNLAQEWRCSSGPNERRRLFFFAASTMTKKPFGVSWHSFRVSVTSWGWEAGRGEKRPSAFTELNTRVKRHIWPSLCHLKRPDFILF